jgi:hypothetical protein
LSCGSFEVEGRRLSVAEYFDKQYKPLRFPKLPCIKVEKK